jgi:hypothetical protein
MQAAHRSALLQAYHLIQDRQPQQARPLILGVLRHDHSNIDAWWLAVYSAQSPAEKAAALERVLQLEPSHPAALELRYRWQQRGELSADPSSRAKPRLKLEQHHAPRRFNKKVWAFRLIGLVCLWAVSIYMLDGFFGGRFSKPIEDLLGIEPTALGWVAVDEGGQVKESQLTREDRIPITLQETITTAGQEVTLGMIRQEEAHTYDFGSVAGAELMLGALFSSNADSPVTALEVWDSFGNVIAREQPMTELRQQIEGSGLQADFTAALANVRFIQFTAPYTGNYTLAVISRPGGPGGQYSLFASSADATIGGYENYLPAR